MKSPSTKKETSAPAPTVGVGRRFLQAWRKFWAGFVWPQSPPKKSSIAPKAAEGGSIVMVEEEECEPLPMPGAGGLSQTAPAGSATAPPSFRSAKAGSGGYYSGAVSPPVPPSQPPKPVIKRMPLRRAAPSRPDWKPRATPFRPHLFETEVVFEGGRFGGKVRVEIPRIILSEKAYDKAVHFVDRAAEEVGWLGVVTKLRGGAFMIRDIWLFGQFVHGATTLITVDGLAQFQQEHAGTPEADDIWENTAFWGHSHVNMGCTPSPQDNRQMEEFRGCGQEFFIRGIFNKGGHIRFDLFLYKEGVVFEDVPWEKLDEIDPGLLDEVEEEFSEHVHPMGMRRPGVSFFGQSWSSPAGESPTPAKPSVRRPVRLIKTESSAEPAAAAEPSQVPSPGEGPDLSIVEALVKPEAVQPKAAALPGEPEVEPPPSEEEKKGD